MRINTYIQVARFALSLNALGHTPIYTRSELIAAGVDVDQLAAEVYGAYAVPPVFWDLYNSSTNYSSYWEDIKEEVRISDLPHWEKFQLVLLCENCLVWVG